MSEGQTGNSGKIVVLIMFVMGALVGVGAYLFTGWCYDKQTSTTAVDMAKHNEALIERTLEADDHRQCAECGKWDYHKNLIKLPFGLELYRQLGNGRINWFNIPNPQRPIWVHPACNKLEKCPCYMGWRRKVITMEQASEPFTNYTLPKYFHH